MWIGPILKKANADSRSPEYSKFITLKDIYRDLNQWKSATEAAQAALVLRPDDMDLATEVKNLSAYHTMDEGKYGRAGSFRDSMRDADKQQKLIDSDKDVRSSEVMARIIADAEAEWKAEPNEAGKLTRYIDALVKSETPEYENRAIELLEREYERTRQFRFRQYIGRIRISQMTRTERSLRAAAQANANDAAARQQYADFVRDRWREELKEYQLWSENYPTDMSIKFRIAERMFMLEQYQDSIPIFQQARNDPKYRYDAATYLGRAFLEAGYTDEAVDTLKALIGEYQLHGDPKSVEMHYWYGRASEKHGDTATALKAFSQVAQWDFNYRDVQARIKRLRSSAASSSSSSSQ
jgi:tetratricopeptide (TPR) repeat protein